MKTAFAANAWSGRGGQGEFLRQMEKVAAALGGKIYSRAQINFSGPERLVFNAVSACPVLRGRTDWLTLLDDLQFDRGLAAQMDPALDLFDGVMGQCCRTFESLKKTRVRLVLTSLNTHIENLSRVMEEECGVQGGNSFVHPLMKKRALSEIECADAVRVISKRAKETFVEAGVPEKKIRVILPAVDSLHFFPSPKKDGVFRVLCASSVDARKGVYYLLKAFEDARIPNSELVLMGGTGDRASKKMLEGFLKRNPNIRQDMATVLVREPSAETFGACSVFVHPALEDGFGLVAAQSLACGRPVIVTRQTGASELIRDGENGFVVESRSADAIKEKLLLLSHDRNLLERMSQKAPAAAAPLTLESLIAQMRNFYEEVLW